MPLSSIPAADATPAAAIGTRSSGTSPPILRRTPLLGAPKLEAPPARIVVIGVGKVGCELLSQIDPREFLVTAVADSTAWVAEPKGLPLKEIVSLKAAGGALAAHPGAAPIDSELCITLTSAEVIVDAASSSPESAPGALARARAALRAGKKLVLASKGAARLAPAELLGEGSAARVAASAVLAGAGRALQLRVRELRRSIELACVPNGTTTWILQAVEQGAELEEAIAQAKALSICEPDPSLDLCGFDAATKLAIAYGATFGGYVEFSPGPAAELRALDVAEIRARAKRGRCTRLVGRASCDGELKLQFEELPAGSPLAVPPDRVAFQFHLGQRRSAVLLGSALGARATAQAILTDLRELVCEGGAR